MRIKGWESVYEQKREERMMASYRLAGKKGNRMLASVIHPWHTS